MALKLYGYEGNPRTRIVRITAEFEGIPLELLEVIPRKNVGKAEYVAKFPLSQGKIPGIEGPDLRLTETIAIVTYLAKMFNRAGLLGDGSNEQEVQVLSWMSWANQELLQTLATWFLPLIPGFTDPPAYNRDAVVAGRLKSRELLDVLETTLDGRQWIIGNHVTLADIMVAIYVSRGLEWVLDAHWRETHPNIMRHFDIVTELEGVKKVIAQFILIDEEPKIESPYA